MATAQRISDGAVTLPMFQTTLQQQERIVGPLVALANDGTNNVMTFKRALGVPVDKLIVLDAYAVHPPEKHGHTMICVGECLVSGATQRVAAYRPN